MGEVEFREVLLEQYKSSCEICGTFPDSDIARQFMKGILLLNPQKLHHLSVEPIYHALSQKITPFFITVKFTDFSNSSKEETKKFQKILKGVISCLIISKTISSLKFANLSFSVNLQQQLCQGLSQVKRLQHLTFEDCSLNRLCGIEKICQSIKNCPSISCLVFKNCGVDLSGAKAVNNLIMHQSMNRNSLLWQGTLRSQTPKLESIRGLSFINLSNNPSIGDEGFREIASALEEDIWITGVVFENCGLTSTIRVAIDDLLKTNQKLESFNLSRNPFLDSQVSAEVMQKMNMRNLPNSDICEESKLRNRTEKGNHKIRLEIPTKVWPQKRGIPYRVERRILEKRENLPAGTLSNLLKKLERAKPKTCYERDMKYINLENIRKLLLYYKEKLSKEKKKRIKAELKAQKLKRRLNHIEKEMAEKYLIDEVTFSYVENCLERIPLLENIIKTIYNDKMENLKDTICKLGGAASTTFTPESSFEMLSVEISKLRPPNSPRQSMARDESNNRRKKRYRRENYLKRNDSGQKAAIIINGSDTTENKKNRSESISNTELKQGHSRSGSSGFGRQVTGKELTYNSEKNLSCKLGVKNKNKETSSSFSDAYDSDHRKTTLLSVQMEVDGHRDNPSGHEDLKNISKTRIDNFDHYSSTSHSRESGKSFTSSTQSTEHSSEIRNKAMYPRDNEKMPLEDTIKVSMESSLKTQEIKNHVVLEGENCSNYSTRQKSNHSTNSNEEIGNSHVSGSGMKHSYPLEKVLGTSVGSALSQNVSKNVNSHYLRNVNLKVANANINNVSVKDSAPNLQSEDAHTSEKWNQHVIRKEANATFSELQPIALKDHSPKINVTMKSNAPINDDNDMDIYNLNMREELKTTVPLSENLMGSQDKFSLMGFVEAAASGKESPKADFKAKLNTKSSKDGGIKSHDLINIDDDIDADKTQSKNEGTISESFGDDDIDHNLLHEETVAAEYNERPLGNGKSDAVLEKEKKKLTEISDRPRGYTNDDFKVEKNFIPKEDEEAKQPSSVLITENNAPKDLLSLSSIEEEIEAATESEDHLLFG